MDPVTNAWFLIAVGIVLWWGSQKMRMPEHNERKSFFGFGRMLTLVGLCLLLLGLFAGFRGPVVIGEFTIGPFPFAHFIQTSHSEASTYAQSNLEISSRPAPGWRGSSKNTLACTVKNNGNRQLATLFIRLDLTTGSTIDLKLDGPFPAKRTTSTMLSIPNNVSRTCFEGAGISIGNVVGARF